MMYPRIKEGLKFDHKGTVAATFCAESKSSLKEGTPKELWYNASSRIRSFIDFCEQHNIPYVILSYKYGLIGPHEVIDNYNISKDEVDFDEWRQLLNNRAKELGIRKIAHIGFLAFASKDIREALEKSDIEIIWCDDFDDLYSIFFRQKTLNVSLIKDIKNYDPSKVSDAVLLDDHRITHAWWTLCHKLDNFPYTCEEVKTLHDMIVKEMEKRGMKHDSPLKEVRSMGLKELIQSHGIKVQELSEENYADLSDQELKALHALSHAKKDCETHDKIVAEMEKRGIEHNSPCEETQAAEQEGQKEEAESSSTETAIEAMNADQITLLKYFTPLKGILGYREGEVYSIENLKEFISEDDFPVAIEKKYDGARLQFHKKGREVKIYSDGGEDVTHRLPSFVQILQGDDWPHELILDTETEMWVDGKHQGREETSGFLRQKTPAKLGEDKYIVPNVFDVLWFNDERFSKHDLNATIGDLHKQPLIIRQKYLDLLPFKQSVFEKPETGQFNRVVTFWANDYKELEEYVEKVSKPASSEGAMIKVGNSIYPLSGMTRKWIKYKKMAELHVITLEKLETRTEGVFNYKVGLLPVSEFEYPEQDLVEVGGKKYLYVGKTFNTDKDLPRGTILTVVFHTLFLYERDGMIRLRIYEPRVYEARPDQKQPDTVKDAISLAEKADLLERKRLADPSLIIPPEDKTWKFVYHHHWRGKSVHGDLRLQVSPDELVGWTINEQPDEAVDEPVLTLKDAREMEGKLDWKLLKQNKHVLVEKKSMQPIEWLSVEGVVEPGGIGATRNYPGVFLIVDKGTVEYGFQESGFHEYFLHGNKMKGRFVVRKIPRQEEGGRTSMIWNAWFPDEQLPYIISKDAVKKGQYPPKGFSLLPKEIRDKIPEEFQYWKKENYKEVRDQLVEALKKGDVKLYLVDRMTLTTRTPLEECQVYKSLPDGYHLVENLFTGESEVWEKLGDKMQLKTTTYRLAKHWWKGQVVVREGPSTQHYDLFIDNGYKYQIEIDHNPLDTPDVAAAFNTESYDDLRHVEGEIPPGKPGNPTKDTPAHLDTIAEGKCVVYEDGDLFKKIGLYVNNKEIIFIFTRANVHTAIWHMKRVEGAPTTMKLSFKGIEQKGDKWVVKGFGLAEGVWNGMFFPADVIEKSAHLLVGKQADIEHNENLKWGVVTKAEYVPDETALYVEVETEDQDVIKDIQAGKYRGFSIDAWTIPDPLRRIIRKILDYDAITLTSNPACGICVIGAGCT